MQLIVDLIRFAGNIPFDSKLHAFIYLFSNIVGVLFILMYAHQFVYMFIGTIKNAKIPDKVFKFHTFGVVISARNESGIITNLINSVRNSDYPQAMLKIFVVADNCTDNTAQICRDLGCIVFERNDTTKIGKGYALNYLFTKLHTEEEYKDMIPEAYIIIDADNVIKSNFITEMNKVYDSGYDMVTSYRNTKNFGKNWITSGYGYWFLHESKHLNNARMMLKNCCAISGTGFLISQAVVKEFGNWSFFTLTEDIQCSTQYALTGRRVAYCSTAELYDEQPETFKQSWHQRQRWAKGLFQVIGLQGRGLIKNTFKTFACWDILTTCLPAFILSFITLITLPICSVVGFSIGNTSAGFYALLYLLINLLQMIGLMFFIGLLICITEWKKIKCSNTKKILYLFTFPVFMITYLPVAISALFKKVEWKPIIHTDTSSIDEIEKQ